MPTFQRISTQEASALLDERDCHLLDIRDQQSYQLGHIIGAHHLDNNSLADFLAEADRSQPVLVYCYHGNSSQSAAQYLCEQEFTEVYSVDGGFELWRQHQAIEP